MADIKYPVKAEEFCDDYAWWAMGEILDANEKHVACVLASSGKIELVVAILNSHPALLEAAKRLRTIARLVTVKQVIDAGDDAIEAAWLNPWCINEGLAIGDETIGVDFADAAIAAAEPDGPPEQQDA